MRQRADEDQRRFRAAMDASAELMLLIDPVAMRYIDANDAACRVLGYSREELLALGPQDIFSKSREEFRALYEKLFAGELNAPTVEGLYRRKDGSTLLVEAFPRPVSTPQGKVVVTVARDITARRREELLLNLEHTVTRCLSEANTASEGLKSAIRSICESQGWECGRYFYADEKAGLLRFGEAWGIEDGTIGRYIEASRDYTSPLTKGAKADVWRTGEPLWSSEISRHGHLVQSTLGNARDSFVFAVASGSKPIGVLSFTSREVRKPDERMLRPVRVIGAQIGQFLQRKRAEAMVRESEERFRSLTMLSSDIYWEQDAEFRFTSFQGIGSKRLNKGTLRQIGSRRWDLKYLNMTPDDWAKHIAVLEAHQPFRDLELCRFDGAGNKVWTSVSGEPVFDAAGVFKGYRGVGKDITERKLARSASSTLPRTMR